MVKNWKTSLFGILGFLATTGTVLHNSGVSIGHWGATDFTQVAAGVATLLIGLYAKDHNVTGSR